MASVAVLAPLVAACGGDAGTATEIEVELDSYTIEPSPLNVPAGDIDLVVTNVDPALQHSLVTAGKGTRTLAPGETQRITLDDMEPGEWLMWCDVPGHRELGQEGQLVVT